MAKLVWDKSGDHLFETGVDHGVLYPFQDKTSNYSKGVVWKGLSSVTESPSGAEANPIYADNIKYLNLMSAEDFGGTIEAYQSPEEFDSCDGTATPVPGVTIAQQNRQMFGFCYRSIIGNDTKSNDYGYKLHLVYGATASPTEKQYSSVNDSPDAITLSWEFSTTPVEVTGYKPTAHMTIDSTKTDAKKLKALEDILYGTETEEPRLPMPSEVITLMTTSSSSGS